MRWLQEQCLHRAQSSDKGVILIDILGIHDRLREKNKPLLQMVAAYKQHAYLFHTPVAPFTNMV